MGIKTSFLILFMATCWGTSLTFRQTHVFSKDVIILLWKAVGTVGLSIFEPSNPKVLSGKEQSNFRPTRYPKSTGLMVWKAALTKTCNAPYQGVQCSFIPFRHWQLGLSDWGLNWKVGLTTPESSVISWPDCLRLFKTSMWPETQMKIKRKYWIFF